MPRNAVGSKTAVRIATERVTILSVAGRAAKLIQADQTGEMLRLRHVAVREIPEHDAAAAAAAVRTMVAALDRPLGRCLLVIPRSEVLVRYATLPATAPEELRRLAGYQLHGELPYPVEECELSLQPLAHDDRGTHVVIAAVHRPVVEPLAAIARGAGLTPEAIAVSTEGVALWAARLWERLGQPPPARWLFAAIAGPAIELGIVANGQLLFMRAARLPDDTPEAVSQMIRETVSSYTRELVAPVPEAILVMGAMPSPAEWESRLAERVDRPVHLVDPASTSLWETPLTAATLELLHEVPMTDLLGVASRPRQIALDLFPLQWQIERVAAQVRRLWRGAATWTGAGVGALAIAGLGVLAQQWVTVRSLEAEAARLKAPAAAVQRMLAGVEQALAARQRTAARLTLLHEAAVRMPAPVQWSAVVLDDAGRLTIRGVAPGYSDLFDAVGALSLMPGIKPATIRSAREPAPGRVEYELAVEAP